MNRDTVNRLVETYHECVASGEKASLFLETRNGLQFANLSVQVPVVKPGTSQKNMQRSRNRKSPSKVRRNQKRLKMFLQRKTFENTWSPGESSIPVKEPSQPDLACCTQSGESSTLDEQKIVNIVNSEENDLENDGNSEKENTNDQNEDKKKERLISIFSSIAFLKSFESNCKAICEESFGEMNKELKGENKTNNHEEEYDNVDNIEDAKLWAMRQKQSCAKI